MIVYNVYGFIYFVDDVKMFKSLENIFEFFFENFLVFLKNMIRKLEFLMV